MNKYRQIYREIKKASSIVIARHIGPDPDALGSSLGLKDIILNTFPNKKVYVVGTPTKRFKFLGTLDKFKEDMYNSLLIVIDTPDEKRIDGVIPSNFKKSIKIDHHPFIIKTCDIEWIDDTASSAAQMIVELVLNTKLKITKEAAEKLYTGIIADTNRFMFSYTTPKTFALVSKLIEKTNIDITKIYTNLYMRPYSEIKFQGYLFQNLNITNNKVAYIIINTDILNTYAVDAAMPSNMINDLNNIKEALVWVTFTYDKDLKYYRTSIRSRGPQINQIATQFGGGGHQYASGVRLKNLDEVDALINQLDIITAEYIKRNENH